MITSAKVFGYNDKGELGLIPVSISDIQLKKKCIMALDGSTATTGCAIIEEDTGNIAGLIAFTRDKEHDESKVRYKVQLKRALYDILIRNKFIEHIYYEEPFIQYAQAAEALLMLRTSVEELIVENEPELDYIKYTEINNKKWKKEWLAPEPCPNNSELEKAAVKRKMVEAIPLMDSVTQDEIDAAAMGFVAVTKLKDGTDSELKSKKKVNAFQYNIKFIGAESEDDMLQELLDNLDDFKIPQKVMNNGIKIKRIDGYGKFDNKVYEIMDNDDLLLVLAFSSKHHGNIILKHRVGHLTAQYDTIYALVWRKSRKS